MKTLSNKEIYSTLARLYDRLAGDYSGYRKDDEIARTKEDIEVLQEMLRENNRRFLEATANEAAIPKESSANNSSINITENK